MELVHHLGIYSRIGVNAMKIVVNPISRSANKEPKTKTLSRVSFMAKRSSKVSSFRTTNLYLCNNFLVNFFLRDFSDVFEYFITTKLNKNCTTATELYH